MAWPFQLKFEIYIFGVMVLQMKQKTQFWKIGPCIFKEFHMVPTMDSFNIIGEF